MNPRIYYFLSGPLHVEISYPPSDVMDIICYVTHVSEATDLTLFWDMESMGVSKTDCEVTGASFSFYDSTRNRVFHSQTDIIQQCCNKNRAITLSTQIVTSKRKEQSAQ
jgi:hypothetical protein